jgi:hypothetical protein
MDFDLAPLLLLWEKGLGDEGLLTYKTEMHSHPFIRKFLLYSHLFLMTLCYAIQ